MRTEQLPDQVDLLFSGGRWWRAGAYAAADGYVRPAEGKRVVEYDAWSGYRKTRRQRTPAGHEEGWIPPYAEFANLHSDPRQERILDFCRKFGLPGSLLHQMEVVTLAPRWARLEDGDVLVPAQQQFIRTNTGWRGKRSFFVGSLLNRTSTASPTDGRLVPAEDAPEAWQRVGVLRRDLRSPDVIVEPLSNTWAKYFPAVPPAEAETFQYPMPLTAEFWRAYAEPQTAILEAIQVLSQALWELRHHKAEPERTKADENHVGVGVTLLHALLAPASATIVPLRDGTFGQQWACGSLLSAMAMMALHDLTENRRVRACAVCGRMFVSQHPAATYCREQCRWAQQKRKQRDRAKSKKRATSSRSRTRKQSARKDRRT